MGIPLPKNSIPMLGRTGQFGQEKEMKRDLY